MTLRLGTRGSALALAQSGLVADALTAATGRPVELVEIVTAGDRSSAPVAQLGVGVFVSALREALLAKEIDFAVHSYKDLPTAPADGLVDRGRAAARRPARRAGRPRRADPRRPGPRRADRHRRRAPDRPAARARRGLGARARSGATSTPGCARSPTASSTPSSWRGPASPGSAAPARSPRPSTRCSCCRRPRRARWRSSAGPTTPRPSSCWRRSTTNTPARPSRPSGRCSPTLEAGCSAPVAALAEVAEGDDGPEIYLRGAVFSPDGTNAIRLSRTGTLADPAEVGRALARDLRAEGADQLMGEQQ